MNVLLGVTGSIAAYKAAEITNRLTKMGHNVDVLLTESGSRFITPLTLQTLSKNKVYMDMFEEIVPSEVKHISLAKKADLVLIAPATANIIGKIAGGISYAGLYRSGYEYKYVRKSDCSGKYRKTDTPRLPFHRAESEPSGLWRSGKGRPGGCRGHHQNHYRT